LQADGEISVVAEGDLDDLLPLMRAYCEFYGARPAGDADLLHMARALIADPEHEGVQLIARTSEGTATGFATIFWTWSTLSAARVGTMNDLFVVPEARGTGVAEALIRRCVDTARRRGAVRLEWQTAADNARAQSLYDRIGAHREGWVDYWLPAAGF
jgi:GNAT superfamily N-acetyltransferase